MILQSLNCRFSLFHFSHPYFLQELQPIFPQILNGKTTGWPSNDVTAEIVRKPLGDPPAVLKKFLKNQKEIAWICQVTQPRLSEISEKNWST